jgi:16S rRNA (adenine1518-N6/adenine1519-N6)-dimethyltransferase
VLLERRPQPPVDVPSYDALFALVSSGFAQRRKMLRRALVPALGERTEAVLVAAGIAPTERAEALDLESWASLARAAAA